MIIQFICRAILLGVPLLYGSTGEIVTEKSGHLNLGIPGIMYVGAISGVVGSFLYENACGNDIANMNPFLAVIIPLVCAILGMVFPGSAQTKIFGGTIIAVFAAAGGNPLLAAAMLPAIAGAMEGMTPPLAICMYTAMGISGSKMKETTLNCLIWVGLHYLLSVLCFLSLLPIIGL